MIIRCEQMGSISSRCFYMLYDPKPQDTKFSFLFKWVPGKMKPYYRTSAF